MTHNTAKDLRDQQSLHILGGKENSRKPCNSDKTGHDGVSVPEPLRYPPIDEQSDNLTHIRALLPAPVSSVCFLDITMVLMPGNE